MTEVTDYYQLLGVPETASTVAIKKAFRVLARTSHPDHNPGDPSAEDRFKLIQRAYHVLSDVSLRTTYDQARALSLGGSSSLFGDERPPYGRQRLWWLRSALVSLFRRGGECALAREPMRKRRFASHSISRCGAERRKFDLPTGNRLA